MNRQDILSNMDNPGRLEKLFRDNKAAFKAEFLSVYPELSDQKVASFWKERLKYEGQEISWGSSRELVFVIIASLVAGLIAKLPAILGINEDLFFQRNIGLVVFPVLTAYFIWRKELSLTKIIVGIVTTLIAAIFINMLPVNDKSDTLILSCIHLPVLLWAMLGFTYVGDDISSNTKRLDFLRYNGEMAIMSGLILIAGVALSGITIGLFEVIGYHIEIFYQNYIAVFGLAAVPVVGTYITQTNPQLVNKISPVIAKIFSPLVLIMLVVYLVAMIFSGKDPYHDRDFLMIFNLLLIGVMAIILFSFAESAKNDAKPAGRYILLALSLVTVIVNGIALSAILFRISSWGITPNRLAICGANILMLINLLMVTYKLFRHIGNKAPVIEVENSIARYLPVYVAWITIVIFIFPFIFHFR